MTAGAEATVFDGDGASSGGFGVGVSLGTIDSIGLGTGADEDDVDGDAVEGVADGEAGREEEFDRCCSPPSSCLSLLSFALVAIGDEKRRTKLCTLNNILTSIKE